MTEFTRPVPLDTIGAGGRGVEINASAAELAALAKRFGWLALEQLEGEARLTKVAGGIEVKGQVRARLAQACVVTDAPVAEQVNEPVLLRFVDGAEPADGDEEVELGAGDLDVLPIEGGAIDLGEAFAQTVALAVDPFPKAPGADDVARAAGVLTEDEAKAAASPFAKLKGLLSPNG